MGLYIAGAILILLIVGVILIYNGLVQKSQMADNGWSDIDVQLKRRANLIPQLVNTVQGYATHERELFADIAEKRAKALAAGDDLASRGEAESALARPVARLMAVAEDYPDMKASQNFLELQQELADTEDKIEMARRFYNGAVRELNTRCRASRPICWQGCSGSARGASSRSPCRNGRCRSRSRRRQLMLRYLLGALAACLVVLTAGAEEKINRFDVGIEVQQDGDIIVTETINVTVEGQDIRRGIFRDLPRYYEDDLKPGDKLPYQYDVLSIRRDGQREPYTVEHDGNATGS